MGDERHHGYANRETWAAQLWLTNDYDSYVGARACVQGNEPREAADALSEWFEELWWQLVKTHDGRNMVWDIGSVWRVEWSEVAQSLQG